MEDSDRVIIRLMEVSRDPQLNMSSEQQQVLIFFTLPKLYHWQS